MVDEILLEDASSRVGLSIFGREWIRRLPPRQLWLVQRYGSGANTVENRSALPGGCTYVPNLGRDKPAALRHEIEIAQDQFEYMQMQRRVVRRWLAKNGFDTCTEILDRSKFENALRAILSNRQSGQQRLTEDQVITEINQWYDRHPKIKRGRAKDKCVTDLNHNRFGKQSELRRLHDGIFGQPKLGRAPTR